MRPGGTWGIQAAACMPCSPVGRGACSTRLQRTHTSMWSVGTLSPLLNAIAAQLDRGEGALGLPCWLLLIEPSARFIPAKQMDRGEGAAGVDARWVEQGGRPARRLVCALVRWRQQDSHLVAAPQVAQRVLHAMLCHPLLAACTAGCVASAADCR